MSRPPSMADVAALAGVSHQTVSRVLNDHPSVRPETRRRVTDAIATLGYRRNLAARALVTARSATIGVVTTPSPLFGPASTLIAVEEAARREGFFVSVASVRAFDAAVMDAVLEHFLAQGVEGIVVIAPHVAAAAAVEAFSAPVPVVLVAAGRGGGAGSTGRGRAAEAGGAQGVAAAPEGGRVLSVGVDQRAGARAATEHLLGLGHTDVLHVAGPQDWVDARERREGWAEALAAHGVATPVEVGASWSADGGYRVGRALVRGELDRPTAVFAANDQLALGLLRALGEGSVRVPGDVSVVGFDDAEGAGYFLPPLTTVRQPFDALGTRCLDLLVDALGGGSPAPAVVAPELVVRESTGTPRGR